MLPNDPLARVLTIDLSRRSFDVTERRDLVDAAIGGAGLAACLLEELCPPGADPLGPENPIVFAVGPLVGLFPLASKTVAMFRSPHTGNLGESHAGGRSATALRLAGYGAIVITRRKRAADVPRDRRTTASSSATHRPCGVSSRAPRSVASCASASPEAAIARSCASAPPERSRSRMPA